MTLSFSKMHALGNDFIVIDAINQDFKLTSADIQNLAHRHKGIGFDQCLVLEAPKTPDTDFFYRIFNASGDEVGQCGNGARCIALFAYERKLTSKKLIKVSTKTTLLALQINQNKTVTVDFGKPRLAPKDIPILVATQARSYEIPLKNGSMHTIYAISVGNPHALTLVNDIESAPVITLGKEISEHPLFPEQTNAGFFQLLDKSTISLRVYERGAGETLACGSGAVAAAAIAKLEHQLNSEIKVILAGGELSVSWPEESNIFLTGPASFVYEGKL